MTIDLRLALEMLVLVATLISGMAVGINRLKKWLKQQVADPMAEAKYQLQPNGGLQETTRHLIENTSQGVDDIKEKITELGTITEKHTIQIQELSNRLDRHLMMDHRMEISNENR